MKDMAAYEEEARHLAKLGDMHKAQVILTKKKHAEKEVFLINFTWTLVCKNKELTQTACGNYVYYMKTGTIFFSRSLR
jgi:hypothetical protein